MQLTADTFLEIVQSLRSDKSVGGLREQRRFPRVGVRGRAIIMVGLKTTPRMIAVNVRDLSAAGIGILVPEAALEKEDEFLLILPQGVRQAKRAMNCTVKRVGQLAESLYSVGAVIGVEIPAEQIPVVAAMPAKPAPGSAAAAAAAAKARAAAARPAATSAPGARPVTAVASVATAGKPAELPVSHDVSADLLGGADADVVNALEARLRAMTD